jgi:hypothetical protein
MQQRLSAAQRYDRRAKFAQAIYALEHRLGWHRLRHVIVLVAIRTRKVAAANRYQMRQNGMIRRHEPLEDHPQFSRPATHGMQTAPPAYGIVGHRVTGLLQLQHSGSSRGQTSALSGLF